MSLDDFDHLLLEATGWLVRVGACLVVAAFFGGLIAFVLLVVRAMIEGPR